MFFTHFTQEPERIVLETRRTIKSTGRKNRVIVKKDEIIYIIIYY